MLFRLYEPAPYAALTEGRILCPLGGGQMAEENGAQPLPRRVPGAADSPRPPARVKPPVLPEDLLERLRTATEAARAREATLADEGPTEHDAPGGRPGRPAADRAIP